MAHRLGPLIISPYKDRKELEGFYCGIAKMDDFFHRSDGFDMSVRNHYCKAFVVRNKNDEILAVFALNFDAVSFDEDNLEDLFSGALSSIPNIDYEYRDNFISKNHHPALEITYLAIREDLRKSGIGRYLVEKLALVAQKQALAGCEFLTVSAYYEEGYSAVNFYSKCQFSQLDISRDKPNTTRMFRILYPKKDDQAE